MKEKAEVNNNNVYEIVDAEVFRSYDASKKSVEDNVDETSNKKNKKVKEAPVESVSILRLFSFCTRCDTLLLIIALLSSIGMGISWPLIILVFGSTTDTLANFQYYALNLIAILQKYNVTLPSTATINDMVNNIKVYDPSFVMDPKYDIMNIMMTLCQYFAGIALAMFVLSYLAISSITISGQNQISAIRKSFFRSIMRQNMGWFDEQSSGALNNSLVDDISSIHVAIGDKLTQMVQWLACGIAAMILAFVKGWKLTLVVLAVSPVLGLTMFFLQMTMTRLNKAESKAYGKAGGVAEEVLGAIRTVVSFRGEKFEVNRYSNNLDVACKAGVKKGILTGILFGLFNGLMFGSYSLGFWYGAKLVRNQELSVGEMLIIFFCCMMSSMGFGQALPHLNTLSKGRMAAAMVYKIIDRVPEIDKMDHSGKMPEFLEGNITFKEVNFHYPTRSECSILKKFSLATKSGQTVALVGASGCGKSSVIQLIQRFYDAIDGEILIDGCNIKDLNVKWLREQIGVVSQEPILFACSIKENIKYGRLDVTDDEINKALEMANAMRFVQELPNKLDTILGERGAQLSGGQKQRIAIARALVRNPKILLLDEATSALDSESERNVQIALDKARIGRTTIIVAHRLSTIRNADVIFGIKDGIVIEHGNHKELIEMNGLYKDLVERQKINEKDDQIIENVYEKENDKVAVTVDKVKEKCPDEDVEMQKKKKKNENYFFRVLQLNSNEASFIFLGCIGAFINGATHPGFSILFGFIIPAMANPDLKKQESDINMYVIAIACIATTAFLANVLQSYAFSMSGERLTKYCRSLTFKAMLRQDMGWFDDPDNNVGALTTRLSDESTAIRGLSGENIGTLCQAASSMGAAIIIAFIFTWQISLVIIAFIPFLLMGGILQVKLMKGLASSDKGALEESGKIAVESIENIKTVSNLTREETFITAYEESIGKLTKDVTRKSLVQGLLFGITQATIFCAYAAVFILAGYLLKTNTTKMENIFISFGSLIFGAMYVGNAIAMAPDYGKGKVAAKHMFGLLDRIPPIDSYSEDGVTLNSLEKKGLVELENVFFKYPLRPNTLILKNITMDIQPNTTVALVGQSGCGKSTIIQLLQRIYDINSGRLNFDKLSCQTIKIEDLRDSFSLVSQEPILFAYSIKENIAYADNEGRYNMQQVEDAARAANIHEFIEKLPDKYETLVGEKGSNLSGGQKQRIAIARALLRNPLILLLDEATSALDTESEKIVQEALDQAQAGRTCIVIAHRLSTIQNADKILVFDEGKIAEIGNHQDLMNQNGIYSNMINMQNNN